MWCTPCTLHGGHGALPEPTSCPGRIYPCRRQHADLGGVTSQTAAAEQLRGSNREAGSTGVVAHTTVPAMLAASEAAASMPLSPASLAAMHRSKEGDSKGATADDETMGRQASPRVPAFLVQR